MTGKKTVLSAAIAALLVSASASAQTQTVTLDQAIKLATEVSPNVVSGRNSIRSAEIQSRNSMWAMLPNVTLNASVNQNFSSGPTRIDPVTGDQISGNTSNTAITFPLQASWTIFDGFQNRNNLKANRRREDLADAALITTQFTVAQQTTTAFLDALEALQTLKVREAAVAASELRLRTATARLAVGVANQSDSLSQVTDLNSARLSLLQQQNTVATTQAQLGRIIGTGGRVVPTDDSSLYRTPAITDTSSLRTAALSASPAIRQSMINLDVSKLNYTVQKGSYWPSLTLNANSNWVSQRSSDFDWDARRGFSATLSFRPWTNLTREGSIENAQLNIINSEANLADQRRNIDAQITGLFATLTNNQEQIRVSRVAVEAAELNLRVVDQRYQAGVATSTEILTAQQSLTSAQVSEVSARFGYLRAKVQLETLLGRKIN